MLRRSVDLPVVGLNLNVSWFVDFSKIVIVSIIWCDAGKFKS